MAKKIWIDAKAGVAGDMLLAALLDAGADFAAVRSAVEAVTKNQVRLELKETMVGSMRAARTVVSPLYPSVHHRSLSDILSLIREAKLPSQVSDFACATFQALAQAEAKAHGTDISQVHFHEVGSWDSLADVVGCAQGLYSLGAFLPEVCVYASPIALGSGSIRIAHGWVSVPAPAVANLMVGWPVTGIPAEVGSLEAGTLEVGKTEVEAEQTGMKYPREQEHTHTHTHSHEPAHDHAPSHSHSHAHSHTHSHDSAHDHSHDGYGGLNPAAPAPADNPIGELATPTGVAILRTLTTRCLAQIPPMRLESLGVGAGGKTFANWANVVRVFVGDDEKPETVKEQTLEKQVAGGEGDQVVEISTNIDDMDPRLLPGVIDTLLASGARDAWISQIIGKKGRPAFIVTALSYPHLAPNLSEILAAHTSTIGVRISAIAQRQTWKRETRLIKIGEESVRVKISSNHDGTKKTLTPEWQDVARVAQTQGRSQIEVLNEAQAKAYDF